MLSQGGILEDKHKLLKETLNRLFSYKVKTSIIPSKCGRSSYYLHCSEVFLTEYNYIQAKQTCKQLCLNYTYRNYKSTLMDTFRYLSNNITNFIYVSSHEYICICVKKVLICETPLGTHGKEGFLCFICLCAYSICPT